MALGENVTSANGSKEIIPTRVAQDGLAAASTVSVTMNAVPRSDGLLVEYRFLQMDDTDLYAASPMRPGRPETRNNLKRTIDHEESDDGGDDDYDEGGPVRSSQEKSKRQRQVYQTSQAPKESSDIRIGHHTTEPLITVFAKLKNESSGKVMTHIYARKTPMVLTSGKSWSDYVRRNGQVNPADATLDSKLFANYADELQYMTSEQKRKVIAEYLHGLPYEEHPAINVAAPTPVPRVQVEAPMYEQRPPFIVGFHKNHPEVPVRVQLRLQSGNRAPALLFKLKEDEVKQNHLRLPKLSVYDINVRFNPEFARPTMEETKAEILSRFVVQDNETGKQAAWPWIDCSQKLYILLY